MNKLLNLRMFDGEPSEPSTVGGEGGENNQNQGTQPVGGDGGTTPQPNGQPSPTEPSAESMFERFKKFFSEDPSNSARTVQEGASKPNDKPSPEPNEDLDKINDRIAQIEMREQMADLRDAGVPTNMVDDAMALYKNSGEKDIAKFLESRPYLKGSAVGQSEPQPKDEPLKRGELSDKEKYLQQRGYLK